MPYLPVLVYVRVSKVGDRDEARLRAPEDQIRRASKFAEENGFMVGRVRARREARDGAATALDAARAEAGVSSSGDAARRLGHIWGDLEPSQQREALLWTFEEVRARKVPRGQKPDLGFVVRATPPWGTLEMRPPEIQAE